MVNEVIAERQLPTLEDVAKLAKVSRATVSRVVNGATLVAPETVVQVQAAISKLGYRPNRAARALVTRRTGVVAVMVPEADDRVFTDPFFPQAYHGALQGFSDSDVQVLLAIAGPGHPAERMLRYLDSGHVDGAIVVSHHGPALARALAELSTPVVFVGDPETPGLPYVDIDQEAASREATQYLVDGGSKRIATITGPLDMAAGTNRLAGFRSALAAAGLSPAGVEHGDFTTAGGRDAAARLLAAGERFDGLFVANDLMAAGALQVLAEAGLQIPEDVRVVGFDNSEVAMQTTPTLTTMTNPASELCREATKLLIELLAGGRPASPVILASHLIRRDSA
ncbi:LacI family DNA-binding transcriptional regulator [Propionicimonas sp.]|uniref:LacI family DNA-binding transcriptional regulator n=1 Tax=Propionicimonas sp. TaxID=1955623 RepID=UPI0025E6CEB0|nr:LacI family DNA-binding transcriptional regulator [Propionicimonas sp.]MCG2805421.1 LacI family transcriptional regulator [Propionicimonas sp.]